MISAADSEAVLGVPAGRVFWTRAFAMPANEPHTRIEVTDGEALDPRPPLPQEPALDTVAPLTDEDWAAG